LNGLEGGGSTVILPEYAPLSDNLIPSSLLQQEQIFFNARYPGNLCVKKKDNGQKMTLWTNDEGMTPSAPPIPVLVALINEISSDISAWD